MSAMQKQAWFNLAVIAVSLAVVLGLAPFMGYSATGGFGVLGFMGFGPFFLRKQPGKVVTDERDHLIQWRAALVAFAVFWVAFVAAGVLSPLLYAECVPVRVVQMSVVGGWILLSGVMAVATLVQYPAGGSDGQ
jgi:hypothetical protein